MSKAASTRAKPKKVTAAAATAKPSAAKTAPAKPKRTAAAAQPAAAKKASAKSRSTTNSRASSKKPAASRATPVKAASSKAVPKAQPVKNATKPKATTKSTKTAAPKKVSEKSSLKTALKAVAAKNAAAKASQELESPVEGGEKAKIAPAPMRPALRVAKRAEARRDKNQTFTVKSKIIYPAHGVGYIIAMEKQTIGDFEVELFVIDFEHEKMKLRVPVNKAAAAGMRNLSSTEQIATILELIEGKARIKRTMWSRRAQEYEAKINSGDLTSVSEVVRDLFRAADQPEQSYSERQLFEQARERLAREIAAVRNYTLEDAIAEIHVHLDRKESPTPKVVEA